jgi:hypothetical protein
VLDISTLFDLFDVVLSCKRRSTTKSKKREEIPKRDGKILSWIFASLFLLLLLRLGGAFLPARPSDTLLCFPSCCPFKTLFFRVLYVSMFATIKSRQKAIVRRMGRTRKKEEEHLISKQFHTIKIFFFLFFRFFFPDKTSPQMRFVVVTYLGTIFIMFYTFLMGFSYSFFETSASKRGLLI